MERDRGWSDLTAANVRVLTPADLPVVRRIPHEEPPTMDEDHDRVGTSGSLCSRRDVDVQLEAVLTGLSGGADHHRGLQQIILRYT